MAFTYSVITDEVSPVLSTGLAFAASEGLSTIDIRSIGGVNFLSLDRVEQRRIAKQVLDAGMTVGCFATPLLKWPKPGRSSGSVGDQFGFDPKGRSTDELYDDAFEAAEILGTRNLRIFSYLTYADFTLSDIDEDLDALLSRAERYGMTLHVENEPVCNIASVDELARLVMARNHPRLKALLDIGNASQSGAIPSAADLAAVMPFVEMMHFKDYAKGQHRVVPMGEGEIPYRELLAQCFGCAPGRHLTLIIETHVPGEQPGATQRSLAALRRLVASK